MHAAFSQEKAHSVFGGDVTVAEKLTQRGVLNKRYTATYGPVYWIRGESETATGTSVPAGFVVILHRDITTPSGRRTSSSHARLMTIRDPRSGTYSEAG